MKTRCKGFARNKFYGLSVPRRRGKDVYLMPANGKNVNDNLKEIEVVSSFDVNLDEENKKRIKDLLEKIKDCCLKGINPSIPFYEYDINDICNNLIKYICL